MKISSPVTCERLLRPRLKFDREEVWCIALSQQCDLLEYRRLGLGGLSQVPIFSRRLIHFTLQQNAEQLILIHTHLGKCSFPSQNDLEWTERLKKLLDLLEVKLCDHIIISQNNFTSLLQFDPCIFE